jgi:hypothetical protein
MHIKLSSLFKITISPLDSGSPTPRRMRPLAGTAPTRARTPRLKRRTSSRARRPRRRRASLWPSAAPHRRHAPGAAALKLCREGGRHGGHDGVVRDGRVFNVSPSMDWLALALPSTTCAEQQKPPALLWLCSARLYLGQRMVGASLFTKRICTACRTEQAPRQGQSLPSISPSTSGSPPLVPRPRPPAKPGRRRTRCATLRPARPGPARRAPRSPSAPRPPC